jgi:hypothetical protein
MAKSKTTFPKPTRLLLWLLPALLCTPTSVWSQRVFPVQGTVMLAPPYSPYLSDLTAPGAQRLIFSVRLADPTLPEYACRLRLRIDGAGISIFTRPEFIGPRLTLPGGGIMQLLYGDDLADYFNPANLVFQGISQRDFARTNRLPEGVYRFTLEVLDYNRGTVVSNPATATAWIVLNDPPLLNLPRQHARLPVMEPIQLAFNWTPRHTASVNAAFTTEYRFCLVELPPTPGLDQRAWIDAANQAILSQPPIYQITTSQNVLIYGPSEPALIAGRLYAWQVQAIDTQNRDLFKNQGHSEVFVFQYGEALGMPQNVRGIDRTSTVLMLSWEPPSHGEMPERYRITYKPDYAPRWYEDVTTNRWHNISGLRADASVQVRVRAERGSQASEYTPVLVLQTGPQSMDFQCGTKPAPPEAPPAPAEPLLRLLPGDRLTINRFSILVATVEGSNGQFAGTGWMKIPAFNGAGVRVRFRGKVDTNYALDGEAESIMTGGTWATTLVEEMERIGQERRRMEEAGAPPAPAVRTVAVSGVIDTVFVNEAGDIVVTKQDGSQQTVPRPKSAQPGGKPETVVVEDSAGNRYRVETNPTTGKSEVTKLSDPASSTIAQSDWEQIHLLIKELLQDFAVEITDYLKDNQYDHRGPSPFEFLFFKSDCLPDDPVALRKIRAYANQLRAYHERLVRFTERALAKENDRTLFAETVRKAIGEYQKKKVFKEALSPADYEKVRSILCGYLVKKGLANVFEEMEECLLSWRTPAGSDLRLEGLKSFGIKRLSECFYGMLFELNTGELIWRATDDASNAKHFVYDRTENTWIEFQLPPPDCLNCDIKKILALSQKNLVRYTTPIEDIIILIDGKDLDGEQSSRILAGAFLVVDIIPGGKIFRPVKRLGRVGFRGAKKLFIAVGRQKQFIGEIADGLYKPLTWLKPADKIDEVIQTTDEVTYLAEDGIQRVGKLEIARSGSKFGVRGVVKGVGNIFKVGDKLVGIAIKQIKQGTNGKYAIIGRSMGNAEITGVRNVYSELKNIRKLDVEIFDASSLTGLWKSKFDDAIAEFAQKTNNWTRKLSNQELLQLKIYKLNKEWAQHLVDEGYTIMDMGDFNNLGFSAFYAMEKATIFK